MILTTLTTATTSHQNSATLLLQLRSKTRCMTTTIFPSFPRVRCFRFLSSKISLNIQLFLFSLSSVPPADDTLSNDFDELQARFEALKKRDWSLENKENNKQQIKKNRFHPFFCACFFFFFPPKSIFSSLSSRIDRFRFDFLIRTWKKKKDKKLRNRFSSPTTFFQHELWKLCE